jgi:hypothetical protein
MFSLIILCIRKLKLQTAQFGSYFIECALTSVMGGVFATHLRPGASDARHFAALLAQPLRFIRIPAMEWSLLVTQMSCRCFWGLSSARILQLCSSLTFQVNKLPYGSPLFYNAMNIASSEVSQKENFVMQVLINRLTLAPIHSLQVIISHASAILTVTRNSSGLQPWTLSLALDPTEQSGYSPQSQF